MRPQNSCPSVTGSVPPVNGLGRSAVGMAVGPAVYFASQSFMFMSSPALAHTSLPRDGVFIDDSQRGGFDLLVPGKPNHRIL